MLYVIDQRLKAQSISLEKSAQGNFSSLFFKLFVFLIKIAGYFPFTNDLAMSKHSIA